MIVRWAPHWLSWDWKEPNASTIIVNVDVAKISYPSWALTRTFEYIVGLVCGYDHQIWSELPKYIHSTGIIKFLSLLGAEKNVSRPSLSISPAEPAPTSRHHLPHKNIGKLSGDGHIIVKVSARRALLCVVLTVLGWVWCRRGDHSIHHHLRLQHRRNPNLEKAFLPWFNLQDRTIRWAVQSDRCSQPTVTIVVNGIGNLRPDWSIQATCTFRSAQPTSHHHRCPRGYHRLLESKHSNCSRRAVWLYWCWLRAVGGWFSQ